jgi:hypothetical protein
MKRPGTIAVPSLPRSDSVLPTHDGKLLFNWALGSYFDDQKKVVPTHVVKVYVRMEVQLHSLLTLVLFGVIGQLDTPAVFTSMK